MRVKEIVHGLHYGVVVSEGGFVGLYYTHTWENPGPAADLEGRALSYAWRVLADPLATLGSRAAAWGMVAAATTAWIDASVSPVNPVSDEVEAIGIHSGMSVALIGFIEPLARRLVEHGAKVTAFDRNPSSRKWGCKNSETPVLPDTYALPLIEEGAFDALIVSGSALAHPGVAAKLANTAREAGTAIRVLLGPSAGIHPWICAKLGFTHVAGSHAPRETREKLVAMVKAGYGYRRFKHLLVKWVVECTGVS